MCARGTNQNQILHQPFHPVTHPPTHSIDLLAPVSVFVAKKNNKANYFTARLVVSEYKFDRFLVSNYCGGLSCCCHSPTHSHYSRAHEYSPSSVQLEPSSPSLPPSPSLCRSLSLLLLLDPDFLPLPSPPLCLVLRRSPLSSRSGCRSSFKLVPVAATMVHDRNGNGRLSRLVKTWSTRLRLEDWFERHRTTLRFDNRRAGSSTGNTNHSPSLRADITSSVLFSFAPFLPLGGMEIATGFRFAFFFAFFPRCVVQGSARGRCVFLGRIPRSRFRGFGVVLLVVGRPTVNLKRFASDCLRSSQALAFHTSVRCSESLPVPTLSFAPFQRERARWLLVQKTRRFTSQLRGP